MNTLFDTAAAQKLKAHKPYQELAKAFSDREFPISVGAVHGSFLALLVEKLVRRFNRGVTLVFPTEKEAEQFAQDCGSFGLPWMMFPWWSVAPYREVPANSPVFGKRVRILSELATASNQPRVLIASARSFLGVLPPPEILLQNSFAIQQGSRLDLAEITRKLSAAGYLRVTKVSVHGEFAVRGEVLDIFLPGEEQAVRVVFEFEQVEDIRRFDVGTQSSGERLKQVRIHAFRELVWTEDALGRVRLAMDALPEFKVASVEAKDELLARLATGSCPGEEIWYPLALETKASLVDYLKPDEAVFWVEYERLYAAAEGFEREYAASWRKYRVDHPLLPRPERLLHALPELQERTRSLVVLPLLNASGTTVQAASVDEEDWQILESHKRAEDGHFTEGSADFGSSGEGHHASADRDNRQAMVGFKARHAFNLGSEAGRSFFGNINFLKDELAAGLKAGYQVFVFADSEVQSERIRHLLLDFPAVAVLPEDIGAGFSVPALGLWVIQENEIFGRRKRIPHSVKKVQSAALDTFVDLEPGDYVVHVNHGIGRFLGIKRIKAGGTERDYIELEYADEEFIFVPIEQVNLVQRYIGNQGAAPRLDKIGGKSWEKRKSSVKKSVEELAGRLIDLYSRRKKARGYPFPPDNEWQIQFEATFPYEETDDQISCIRDVKADMEKPMPMDRLVCGDVGYGKTEIALRAAFKAVSHGKQVAFLAPTTILAEQHYENLAERIKGFPVNVGMLSRFVAPKDQKTTLAGVAEGKVDIVIGTHRLLQKDVVFKDLGLIVIDEEQRFGVKDKERLKEMKHSVDCLTLTATPIPRTLHMSLLKIRDMSVLQTPPYNRRPIETHVRGFDDQVVADAIRKEIGRGGQVFYLHNRVESLENVVLFLQKVVPEVLVESAHGQMSASELEDIMHRFIHGAFHVLVATTIIENGINIPNVNTIIIDRADMYGISQLYQLRGRVGRSGRLAYAYLLYPGERALSELAMKRLQIISDHTELGSGFKIALKDLEVRGAGNLLGAEQSGEIVSVGFDLYLRLLDEAVRRLANEDSLEDGSEIVLDLEYTGFIPDSYVKEPAEKMEVYKKIASVATDEQLEAVFAEITDRFGPIPDEVQSLLGLAEIRIIAKKLHVITLRERKQVLEVEFGKISLLNVTKVMELIRSSNGTVRPDPHRPQVLLMNTDLVGLQEKAEFIRDRLMRLL
jgi:transcription-repair coupling factor (superfamily II helicase)